MEEVTTNDGQVILIDTDDGLVTWVGATGRYTSDDLRDIADALDEFDPASA